MSVTKTQQVQQIPILHINNQNISNLLNGQLILLETTAKSYRENIKGITPQHINGLLGIINTIAQIIQPQVASVTQEEQGDQKKKEEQVKTPEFKVGTPGSNGNGDKKNVPSNKAKKK